MRQETDSAPIGWVDHADVALRRVFRELGFKPSQAVRLADAGVSTWKVERLLIQGCAHELVVRILV